MASPASTSLSPEFPSNDINPAAYATMFSVGFVVLLFLVSVACYGAFRPRHESNPRVGKRGLDERVVGSYPTMVYSQLKFRGDGFCSICLAEYVEVDVVLLLPNCGHYFHDECVDPWLRVHTTCPICRSSHFPASVPPDRDLESREIQ